MSLTKWMKSISNGVKDHLRMIITEPSLPTFKPRMSNPLAKAAKSYIQSEKRSEADPLGRDPHQPGAKLDAGKSCVYQGALGYFPRAIEQVAAISTFGASKYAWKGWETVPDGFNRYSDALGRHLLKEGTGERDDPDSGLPHAAHAAWNALARLELMLKEQENAEG
jgi:hypothetical protein